MDKKRRPSVLITTYASTCCFDPTSQQQSATKSERSTEFFTSSVSVNNSNNNRQVANKTRILYELNQIKGPSGSVRGHEDVVKKSLESLKVVASSSQRNFTTSNLLSFGSVNNVDGNCRSSKASKSSGCSLNSFNSKAQRTEEVDKAQYLARLASDEQNLCVAYITSLSVIRRTFDDSSLMK